MNLYTIITVGIILSVAFHFVGVYAKARNIVWIMIVLMWAGSIGFAMNEISAKGYASIDTIKGQYADVDQKIEQAKPEISLYEMLEIRKTYDAHQETQR